MLTAEQLKQIVPAAGQKRIDVFLPLLNKYMAEYHITNLAAFLATLAHESMSFVYTQEIASGAAYEGRKDLGNDYPGDGKKFKGRGLIQITGRTNYHACSLALFDDNRLLQTPELLSTPDLAVKSACWFWVNRGLHLVSDFKRITRIVNGGYNGMEDRLKYYNRAIAVLYPKVVK